MPELPARWREVQDVVAVELPDLPYVRLSQRSRPPRRRRATWALLALVLAAHVLLGWLAYLILSPTPSVRAESGVLAITLIEPAAALPPPPAEIAPPPLPGQPVPAARPPLVHREPPAPGAMRATLEGAPEPALRLYDANGQVRLPAAAPPARPPPAYVVPELKGSHIASGKSPIPYAPTPFNQDWSPVNEGELAKTIGRMYEKAVEKTSVVKTIRLPGGLKVKCGIAPLLLGGGCMPPPPPPPPSDRYEDDARLSLPPAAPLAGKPVASTASASSVPPPASASSVPPPASGRAQRP